MAMRCTWGPGKLVTAAAVLILGVVGGAATGARAQPSLSAVKSVVPDSCDLRLLEVNTVQPGPLWAALLKAVRVKQPELAASLSSKGPDESQLRKAVERAMSPGAASDSDRDLLLLTADQFLRHHGDPGLPVTLDDELDPAWVKLGFRSYR